MLQQTQVATVESYFGRFTKRFPTVRTLAVADESEVLRLWEGLGYYRRARQLHLAAKQIVEKHSGEFPTSFEDVLSLPGIGRYTAGAILSIAHDARLPILEANTIRLFARLLGYRGDPRDRRGQSLLWEFASCVLPRRRVGRFNQALMELGSIVCTPRNPACDSCPISVQCPTCQAGLQDEIPQLAKRVRYEDVREVAVVIHRQRDVLLRRCAEDERWAGMWDFPRFRYKGISVMPTQGEVAKSIAGLTGFEVQPGSRLTTMKHGVTRFRISLDCFEAHVISGPRLKRDGDLRWVPVRKLDDYPLSVTGRKLAKLLD